MTTGKIQAKDIPDQALIDLIDRLWNAPRAYVEPSGKLTVFYPTAASIFDICKQWDAIPAKVIQTKLKSLKKRHLIDGCCCGCRGDFTVVHETDLPLYRIIDVERGIDEYSRTPRLYRDPKTIPNRHV